MALVGTWMQAVAQSWLVLQLTDSPLRLGLVGTLQSAPVLLFCIPAGAIADRLPKRRVLVLTQLIFGVDSVALALLVWSGAIAYWHVCALGLVVGVTAAIDQPTRQAFVVDMVGREDVGNAVALNSAAFNAARIVGPAVAGVLIARVGMAPAFALNAVGFAVVIAALLRLRALGLPRPPNGTTMGQEILEGLRYAAGTPAVALVLGLLTVVSLFVFNFSVYVPLLARTVLGLGAEGFGFLMAGLGVGAVAGALTVGALRHPPVRVLFGAAAIALGGLLALSAVGSFWTAVPLLALTGFAGIVLVAGCNTRLQLEAPAALRGRVMGLYVLLSYGVFPIGAFVVGAISQRWGVSTAFLLGGVCGLVALAALFGWWRGRALR